MLTLLTSIFILIIINIYKIKTLQESNKRLIELKFENYKFRKQAEFFYKKALEFSSDVNEYKKLRLKP